jgi:uncharacterized membrane protein SpoIIM required for sporulation
MIGMFALMLMPFLVGFCLGLALGLAVYHSLDDSR